MTLLWLRIILGTSQHIVYNSLRIVCESSISKAVHFIGTVWLRISESIGTVKESHRTVKTWFSPINQRCPGWLWTSLDGSYRALRLSFASLALRQSLTAILVGLTSIDSTDLALIIRRSTDVQEYCIHGARDRKVLLALQRNLQVSPAMTSFVVVFLKGKYFRLGLNIGINDFVFSSCIILSLKSFKC